MSSPWKTKRGYDSYEAMSALQKSIRRGLLEDALYWGWEIASTSHNHAARLWSRLLIIVSEDIGLAEPFIGLELG